MEKTKMVQILVFVTVLITKSAILALPSKQPTFQESQFQFQVLENQVPGTFVGRIQARGCEAEQQIVYSLRSDNVFSIDTNSGILRTAKRLDREMYMIYYFEVFAACSSTDGYGKKSNTTVAVYVLDVNDNAPTFDQYQYDVDIDRESPIGTPVIQVRAFDRDAGDNGLVTYSFQGEHATYPLVINSSTGLINTNARLGTARTKIMVVVNAMDGGPLAMRRMTSAVVNIHVTRNYTYPPPVFDQTSYTFGVVENTEIGTFVGQVHAMSEAGIYTYVLYDDSFTIKSNGSIFTKTILDRESQREHLFNVTAVQSDTQFATVSVRVYIIDVNDNALRFPYKNIAFHLNPLINSGDMLGTVVAIDDDQGQNTMLSYSIRPTDGFLAIDSETGMMSFHGNYSNLTQNVYIFSVSVSDGLHTSSVPVLIYTG